MMRQVALQCLRSTKNTSKSKSLWLANTKTISAPKHGFVRTTTPTHQRLHFCTNTAEELTVTTSEPILVPPARPTRRELKELSFIDDRDYLRIMVPIIQIYRHDPSMHGKDPARVIRDALAKALVLYYPLAGHLVEGLDGRLSVDCTGDGVSFVEADADVELAQLGDPPRPPFPWFDKFLLDAPTSGGILNSPLLYFQVTRLKCGSFVLAIGTNHILCDAAGMSQFLTAVGEIARGAHTPSVAPVWKRQLFRPPRREEKAEQPRTDIPVNKIDLVQHSIFLRPSKLSSIRMLAPDSTTFEILTAYLWRCRVSALKLDPEEKVCLMFTVNARDKANSVVPAGYYGNALVLSVIETSAGKLCERPIEYAIGLVKKAKEEGKNESASWRTESPVIRVMRVSDINWDKMFYVTDLRQLGLGDVDFGWGKATYAGSAKVEVEGASTYVPFRNGDGEDGILVFICLKAKDIESIVNEVERIS